VYDTLITRGVPPHISQFNSLMEQYALRFQLGSVVSVLTTMIAGGVQPNANTFRYAYLCVCMCVGRDAAQQQVSALWAQQLAWTEHACTAVASWLARWHTSRTLC
jgi:hypothetical protein